LIRDIFTINLKIIDKYIQKVNHTANLNNINLRIPVQQ